MIHIGPVDPHRPLGACCVYKITNIATGKAYIGKTVAPLEKYIQDSLKGRTGHIGSALRKDGRAAFRSEILLVGTEDFCFRDVIDGKPGGMERRLIAAYGTLTPGGYNLGEGGEGWTSDDVKRWHKTPEGRASSARGAALGGEAKASRAGYPQRRVLEALEEGRRTTASLVAALGLNMTQIRTARCNLRRLGHHIIGEPGGLYSLVTLEEAADDWASGSALTNEDRVLGALMEGPHTIPELMAALGMPRNSVSDSIGLLRKNGHNIENRGSVRGPGGHSGTFHMIQDERHPWLHFGTMDLRRAAWDDRCNSVANSSWSW